MARIDTSPYETMKGKAPSGFGEWAFSLDFYPIRPEDVSSWDQHPNVFWFSGKYEHGVEKAKALGSLKGAKVIYVMGEEVLKSVMIGEAIEESLISFMRGSWARNKVIRNWGGNFWGPNRNRCSIFQPAELKELVALGVIEMQGPSAFIVVTKKILKKVNEETYVFRASKRGSVGDAPNRVIRIKTFSKDDALEQFKSKYPTLQWDSVIVEQMIEESESDEYYALVKNKEDALNGLYKEYKDAEKAKKKAIDDCERLSAEINKVTNWYDRKIGEAQRKWKSTVKGSK